MPTKASGYLHESADVSVWGRYFVSRHKHSPWLRQPILNSCL
jgi:hypothetical protein